MTPEEAQQKASELVQLSLKAKEIGDQVKLLKAELKEYTDIENINDIQWNADNGFVEVTTVTKYKLADIPSEVKVPSEIAAIDVAEKAFKSKIVLSKEGKKMFRDQYPTIVDLMIPTSKKELKVHI